MGIAKRMHSKVKMGAPWRGVGGVDLLAGVGVYPDGTLYLRVREERPERPAKQHAATADAGQVPPPAPRERRQRKPGKLKPRA